MSLNADESLELTAATAEVLASDLLIEKVVELQHELADLKKDLLTQRLTVKNQPLNTTLPQQAQDTDLRLFVQELIERQQKRKDQINIIKTFLDDPLRFGAQTDLIPSSTSIEEVDQRKKELQYRIDLLKTLLDIMEGEMKLLAQGETLAKGAEQSTVD